MLTCILSELNFAYHWSNDLHNNSNAHREEHTSTLTEHRHAMSLKAKKKAKYIIKIAQYCKKSLKIPKEELEAVDRRKDNAMAKKRRQSMVYKIFQAKLKFEQHEPHLNRDGFGWLLEGQCMKKT